MNIPNLHLDSSGDSYLMQLALAQLGFYQAKADNNWGPKSEAAHAAFKLAISQGDAEESSGDHDVKASSFADDGDVRAFRQCKANGGSDQHCFSKGDNGIGFTGLDCANDEIPYVALPPEDWQPKYQTARNATGKPVSVTIGGKTVECRIGDTMPHKANITNGAGIDLAPGAQKAFGLKAPFMVSASWRWV
jgi:hypothetical protein